MTASAMPKIGVAGRDWRRSRLLLAQLSLVVAFLAFWQLGVSDRNLAFFSRPSIVAAKLVELLFDPDFITISSSP